ncbi:glycosyltransferase [Lachnospiraceae bacterium OttesenSCG-928-D06]|nr:glycosyltransferase [Lachnospiraceae bacterium OttesenSCG-928-D06]
MKKLIKNIGTKILDIQYKKKLRELTGSYEEWIKGCIQEENIEFGRSGFLRGSIPDFKVFKWKNCKLSEDAIYRIGCYFNDNPKSQLLYGDEDSMDYKERKNPWFKPEWSPDTFESCFYFGGIVAIRSSMLSQYMENRKEDMIELPLFPQGALLFEYADKMEMIAGMSDLTRYVWKEGRISSDTGDGIEDEIKPGWNNDMIKRVPYVLSHRPLAGDCVDYMEWSIKKDKIDITKGKEARLVSVIIPSKDNPEVLQKTLVSLINTTADLIYEIIIIDNGSKEYNRKKVEKLISELTNAEKGIGNIKYFYEPMEFNFSYMCNKGAHMAEGDYLLFLNDDVELRCKDFLSKMLSYAKKQHVGAVGLKLYYPESKKIQHVGIASLENGPVHKLQFMDDNNCYYFGYNKLDRNVLAVTGACMLLKKQVFQEVSGFFEGLKVAFNDVDLCLTIYEKGYHNVVVNTSYAWHHESLSRGDDESKEKISRLMEERDLLKLRHPEFQTYDPYYPKELEREFLDTSIRGDYVKRYPLLYLAYMEKVSFQGQKIRQDQCLLIRLERCDIDRIQGYSVVLGDDNACYKKFLLLRSCKDNQEYMVEMKPGYRPDLEENMKDQIHVALCGINVIPYLEKIYQTINTYQVGVLAEHRISGMKLINYTNRYLTVTGNEKKKN